MVEISISADGFLRYMVRSIVGTLMAAGRGEMDDDLVSRESAQASVTWLQLLLLPAA